VGVVLVVGGGQYLGRRGAERVDQSGVELAAGASPGDRQGGRHTTASVVHLDHVGEVEEPDDQGDLLAADTTRDALAVPAREELPDRLRRLGGKTELVGQRRGDQAMTLNASHHSAATRGRQRRGRPQAKRKRLAPARMTEEERHPGKPAQVGLVTVRPKRDVVTEAGGHLRSISHATHPRQHRDMEERGLLLVGQPDAAAETRRDLPTAQQMFHGLTQAEVRGERERSEQLGKGDTGVALVHVLSLGTNQPRGYGAARGALRGSATITVDYFE
jgi:hypothetical protein